MTTQTNETPKEPVKEYDQEQNFERLRKKLEATEREKQQAFAKVAAYEKEIAETNKRKDRDAEPEEDVYNEPFVDERRLNKKLERFEEKFSKKVDQVAEAKARAMVEQERNAEFLKNNQDFNQILTPELIEKFATKHPEIAEPLLEMPEGFARQKLLYQNIKLSGIHKPPENKPSIQETIDKNKRGPFYQPTGVGNAPYAGGGDFSEAGQKSAYERVQEVKKRLKI